MPRRSLFALAVLFCALSLSAQSPTEPPPLDLPAPIQPQKTTATITLDGDLSDEGWKGAAVIDRFYETSPGDNTPPKVNTTAYVTYDDTYFYIGVRADDPEPSRIRAPYVDRDAVIGTDDNIAVFLDTRNDKRSAVELRVNPRGVQGDAIFNDANGSEDFAPDFFYDTAARIDERGWSAEFRVPFSSLRYNDSSPQTWNILVWRNYPRDFRYAFHSAPIPRGGNCLVCRAHPLVNLTDLPRAGHLVAAPYITAQQHATPRAGLGTPLENDDADFDAGLDVKWTPNADHAVDLTLNPDFSQVEADTAQVTVNRRFAVFFPEKRPFFLEGFDLFDTPMQVLYTRTITDPQWGARGTGKIGGTAYTALVTQDEGGGLTIIPGPLGSNFAPQDFKSTNALARVRHDLGRSFIGGTFTTREYEGGGHNRVIGPDFQWRPTGGDAITAQFLYSDTQNPDRPDLSPAWNGESSSSHAFSANWRHTRRTHDWFAGIIDIGRDFRADLGFIPQVGYREVELGYGRRYYPENSRLRFVRPSIAVSQAQDLDDDTISRVVSVGIEGQGAKNLNFFIATRPSEQIRVGNELLSQTTFQAFVQIDPHRRLPRISLDTRYGDSIDYDNGRVGEGGYVSANATMRPHDRLDLQLTLLREWLDVDDGRLYTANVQRLRAQYSFSHRSLIRLIGQYVTTEADPSLYTFPGVPRHSGNFLGSVLYSYKINWQTVLFVGYGDDRLLTPANSLVESNRSLFFKVSYAYQR
ncbi:MAG TPA: DUF5916 domain-containing protein [Thermoanaerobaculia bacterium]|jgi:hypothetical protein